MCGIIAGVSASEEPQNICFDGTHERVTELTARMVHRGPDEMGVHLGGNFWMGHTRLSIVSPEHGEQPLSNKDNTSFAVVNGEVYNHLALREELNIDPDVFKTQSDSEIVIHGYDKLGVDIADKLLGMFAFVLVTNGGKDVLVARDKIGIKPLYMGKSKDGSEYLFSSELKSIVD
jgi:asparagine synthase (glutamine-hydrolysing)